MPATIQSLGDMPQDHPVAMLHRRKVEGERMLWAYINLDAGCHVPQHTHDSEQIAFVISGKVLWMLGEAGTDGFQEVVVEGGTVIRLPSNYPHGVKVLEDSVILDVLSPPGPMGVDRMDASDGKQGP
jgi:quercetin dioxygenase-like cupin family protein